jgi:hypothetical protein
MEMVGGDADMCGKVSGTEFGASGLRIVGSQRTWDLPSG